MKLMLTVSRIAGLLCMAGLFSAVSATPARAQAAANGAASKLPPGEAHDSLVMTDQRIEAGRAIFHGNGTCHACHGDDLQGGPVAPSLRGPKWKHIDGSYRAIVERVEHGRDGTLMVAEPGGITDAEAVEVATYVYAVSQGKAKP
jgi:mono/diheme cytochrome c family protein